MIWLRLSRVAIVAILIITAIPAGLRDPTTIYWPYWRFIFRFRDIFANVLLYFPLGFFLEPRATLVSVTGFGAGVSAIIEVAQLFFVRRYAQPVDVIANTAGALCGGLAGRFFRVRSDRVGLGTVLGMVAIVASALWSAAYLSIWRVVPPFVGRGTTAAVAFLCAMGLTGILKPRSAHYRIAVGIIGGVIAAAVLFPARSMPLFSTFALGIVFGIALVFCTTKS